MKDTWYCAQCGSRDIRHDGILQWDREAEDWTVLSSLDDSWCEPCSGKGQDERGEPTWGQPPEFTVVVYIPEGPSQGEVLLQRPVDPDEAMDARAIAQEVADEQEQELSQDDGHIPNCSGDLRVEFRRDPDNAVAIYSGESFYFRRQV